MKLVIRRRVVVKVAAAAVAVAKMVSRGVAPLGNLEVSVCGKVGLFILRENWGFDDAPDMYRVSLLFTCSFKRHAECEQHMSQYSMALETNMNIIMRDFRRSIQ